MATGSQCGFDFSRKFAGHATPATEVAATMAIPPIAHLTAMNIGKVLSLLLAAAYLIAAFTSATPETGLRVLLFLLLPMACIWFSEELGEFTGNWGGQHIDQKSPGCVLTFVGWVMLLMPLLAVLFLKLLVKR